MELARQPGSPRGKAEPTIPEIGDFLPDLVLRDQTGRNFRLYADWNVGAPVVLCWLPALEDEQVDEALTSLQTQMPQFRTVEATVVAVSPAIAERHAAIASRLGLSFPLLSEPDGESRRRFGVVPGSAAAMVIDPHCRLAATHAGIGHASAGWALGVIRTMLARRHATLMEPHAPVLCIPDVLSREECRFLIEVWGRDAEWRGTGDYQNAAGDFRMQVDDYARVDRVEYIVKDPAVSRRIDKRIGRRVIPQIRKAFQYRVTRREHYHIACYEGARGGFQNGHRDNPTPELAHRRFALSLNLNTGGYEGGELRFREYGEQRYRLAAGSALVFSSSLLHEALAVTTGRRFVLLTHFYGEDSVRPAPTAAPSLS